jgi:transposase InsO family protein
VRWRRPSPDSASLRSSTRIKARSFTSFAFTNTLKDADIRISMDGRGRWMDNVFIERLWRWLKYECVYLNAFETGSDRPRPDWRHADLKVAGLSAAKRGAALRFRAPRTRDRASQLAYPGIIWGNLGVSCLTKATCYKQ